MIRFECHRLFIEPESTARLWREVVIRSAGVLAGWCAGVPRRHGQVLPSRPMIVGALPVHFATGETAAALRADAGDVVREIRGWASEDDLFRALASSLQLPDYFGHNWDAFDECLREVDTDVVLLVHDAATMWREAPGVASTLVDVWLSAAPECEADIHLVFVW